MLFILFIAIAWLIICIVFVSIVISKSRTNIKSSDPQSMYDSSSCKIGAVVNPELYDEVRQYCRRNHMTISDLIRNAVKAYMDSN